MPRVAQYEQQSQLAPVRGGFSNVQATPDQNAGSTARAAGGALTQVADIGQRIQERSDLDHAFRLETQVMADYSEFEQNLRKTRRGANSEGVLNDADTWWSKLDETYGKDTPERVKALTAKSFARLRQQSLNGMGQYQMAEQDRAQQESFTAVNGQEIQRAMTDGRVEVIETAQAKIDSAVNAFGATRGWDADQLAQEKRKWSNMLYSQAVVSMIDRDPAGAKKFFEVHRADIDTANHERMSQAIDKKVDERTATDNAAKWAALPFEDAIANANKIDDPDQRQLTLRAIRDLQQDKNTANALREKQVSDQVWQLASQGVPLGKLPTSLLMQMDGKERMQLKDHYDAARRRAESEAKGKPVKTDFALYEQLASLKPGESVKVNGQDVPYEKLQISMFQDRVSAGDLKQLIDRRSALLSKDPKKERSVFTFEQTLAPYITGLTLKDESKGALQKAAQDAVLDFKRQTGKDATDEDMKKLFDQLTMKPDSSWYEFSKPRAFETIGEIPSADMAQIRSALQSRGIPLTPNNILTTYQNAQKGKK